MSAVVLKHPAWAKALVIPAIAVLVVMALAPALVIGRESHFLGPAVWLLVPYALLLLYFAYRAIDIYRLRHVELTIDPDARAIRIRRDDSERVYQPDEIAYRAYKPLRMLLFYDAFTGEKLAAYDYEYPNCKQVVEWVRGNLTVARCRV